MPRGTIKMVTRGAFNGFCVSDCDLVERYAVRVLYTSVSGNVTRQYDCPRVTVAAVIGRRVPIMGNNEAVGGVQKDQNTPQIWIMSGCVPEMTKLPLPLGGYINEQAEFRWGVRCLEI
ncbi:hypothetical protein Tco_0671789 [Tanacetum coccineum]